MKPTENFNDLIKLVQRLRKECPWDRVQTHESIKDNLIEETYEAIETIDENNKAGLKEELGDLLLQVVFHSRMAAETDDFTIKEVIYALQKKLIVRHPHVFDNVKVKDQKDVEENWEKIKLKQGRTSVLEGIPKHMPALIQAQRLQEKAGKVGFDWKHSAEGKKQVWHKLMEELSEFKEAYKSGDKEEIDAEFGDLLFSIVNAGRFLGVKAEDCLRGTNRKFKKRFNYIEEQFREKDRSLSEVSLEEMEDLWQEAKRKES